MSIDPTDPTGGSTIGSPPGLDVLTPKAANAMAANRGQEKPW